MLPIEPITHADDPRIDDYQNVPDADLLARRGLFMAEGRLVIRALLAHSRFPVRSLLVTPPALESLREALEEVEAPLPIYLAEQRVMDQIAGFHIHRGALAAAERGEPIEPQQILASASRVLVLEALTNHDNVGGIFRNALAFGVDAILLCPKCCDPLYRKSIRVSMGAALRVPFARLKPWPAGLDDVSEAGFRVVALTPEPRAQELFQFVRERDDTGRLALLIGSEGPGLSRSALERAGEAVRIDMAPDVDSLNVATATGIALHALARGDLLR